MKSDVTPEPKDTEQVWNQMGQVFKDCLDAAEKGDARAQYHLWKGYCEGVMVYWHGEVGGKRGGIGKDMEKGVKWLCKAAEQGYAPAQFTLGTLYLDGTGVEKDIERGVEWLRKAAEQRSIPALSALGIAYWKGIGVEKNVEKAIELWRRAIGTGVQQLDFDDTDKYDDEIEGKAMAHYGLARCYHEGIGVEKDLEEAVRRYRQAAEGGIEEAKKILEGLTK